MGADLVGGLDPVGIDGDRDGPLDTVFGLAERHGRGIDIHLHDGGEAGLDEIDAIVARTKASGLGGQVTISHAFALADADDLRLGRIADALREAGITLVSSVPGTRRCPPIPRLRDLGVAICFGTDNVRDCWNPSTVTGMIDRVLLAAYRFDLRSDRAGEGGRARPGDGGPRRAGRPRRVRRRLRAAGRRRAPGTGSGPGEGGGRHRPPWPGRRNDAVAGLTAGVPQARWRPS
jgi:hypothetical protein